MGRLVHGQQLRSLHPRGRQLQVDRLERELGLWQRRLARSERKRQREGRSNGT